VPKFRETSEAQGFNKVLYGCADHSHNIAKTGQPTTYVTVQFKLDAPEGVHFPLETAQRNKLGSSATIKLKASGVGFGKKRLEGEEKNQANRAGMPEAMHSLTKAAPESAGKDFTAVTKSMKDKKVTVTRDILVWIPPPGSETPSRQPAGDSRLHDEVTAYALEELYRCGEATVSFQVIQTSKNLGHSLVQLELSIGALSVTSSPLYLDSSAPRGRNAVQTAGVSEVCPQHAMSHVRPHALCTN
jgi:hypothetical protein